MYPFRFVPRLLQSGAFSVHFLNLVQQTVSSQPDISMSELFLLRLSVLIAAVNYGLRDTHSKDKEHVRATLLDQSFNFAITHFSWDYLQETIPKLSDAVWARLLSDAYTAMPDDIVKALVWLATRLLTHPTRPMTQGFYFLILLNGYLSANSSDLRPSPSELIRDLNNQRSTGIGLDPSELLNFLVTVNELTTTHPNLLQLSHSTHYFPLLSTIIAACSTTDSTPLC